MRVAGYCDVCQQNVFLDNWVCVQGHDRSHITGWYNSETGQAITPFWLLEQPEPIAAQAQAEPTAAPAAEPDPAESMLVMLAQRLESVGLGVARRGSTLVVTGGDAYEARIGISGDDALITLWEYLAGGIDPGVRDFVRRSAASGWKVQVLLHRPDSDE